MMIRIGFSEFDNDFKNLEKHMRAIRNEDYTYDVEHSEEMVVKGVPKYIYIVFKINDLEFNRVEFEANYPVDDTVIFLQKTEVSDPTMQEFLNNFKGW